MFRRESLRTDMNDVDAKTDRIDIDIYRCVYIYIYRQGIVLARMRSHFIFTLYYTSRTVVSQFLYDREIGERK